MPLADLIVIPSNWLASESRPRAFIVNWNGWFSGTGGPPICPETTSIFCPRMAFSTSWVVSPKVCRRFGSSQTRML